MELLSDSEQDPDLAENKQEGGKNGSCLLWVEIESNCQLKAGAT